MTGKRLNESTPEGYPSPYPSPQANSYSDQSLPPSSRSESLSADADRRARPARAAALRRKLGERDLALLGSLYDLRLFRGDQIRRLYVHQGSHSATTRRRRTSRWLQRLIELKLLVRYPRTVGGVHAGSAAHVVGLTGLALAVLEQQGIYGAQRRTVWVTQPDFADHVLDVAELYVSLAERIRTTNIQMVTFKAEPGAWRKFVGADGLATTLKPDAYVELAPPGVPDFRAFIEADRGTERTPTLVRKLQAYISYYRSGMEQQKHEVFPLALWLTQTARRKEQIEEVVRKVVRNEPKLSALFQVELASNGPTWLISEAAADEVQDGGDL